MVISKSWILKSHFQWQFIDKSSQYGKHNIEFPLAFNQTHLSIILSKGNGIYESPYVVSDYDVTNTSYYIGGTAPTNYIQIGLVYGFYIGI